MTDDTTQRPSRVGVLLASRRTHVTLALASCLLCAGFLLATIYAAFCAFTWFKFALFDYGIYTNMIWNSGRGRLFLVLTTRSYLKTHLSFSLALFGPLFYVWNHPFLLSVVQWCMLAGGVAGLALAGVRNRIEGCLVATIALFYVAYPLTQSVLLCEFHGVAGYLLLIPWLYYCLSFKKALAWVPLLLLLGLREDAFLLVLPILAYFGVRDRSRAAWVMLAVSVAYGLLAVFWLFPAVVGRSLLDRRAGCVPDGSLLQILGPPDVLSSKLKALAWVALPTIFFLRRGWPAVLTFLSAPVLISLGSTFEAQYELKLHYPAAVMACLGTALIESSARSKAKNLPNRAVTSVLAAGMLLAVTLGAHLCRGYLPLGGKFKTVYARPNRDGLVAIRAARKIPRDGILMAPDRLMPFCANRRAITKWQYLGKPERPRDLIFVGLVDLFGRKKSTFHDLLASGEFGLQHIDSSHVLLVKGADTAANAEMLAALDASDRTVYFHATLRHGGENLRDSDGASVRHWTPSRQRGALTVAYGLPVKMPPGEYEAVFHLKVGTLGTSPGTLSLHALNEPDAIVQTAIAAPPDGSPEIFEQRLRFSLSEKTRVEPRVTAADTELWLYKVDFRQTDSLGSNQ